jgi:hypothetical protein
MKQELAEGEDYYLNKDGLLVFTEKFLLDRGYCCGSGCLHCPYNYDAVAEPKRSELLKERNTNYKNSETNSGKI